MLEDGGGGCGVSEKKIQAFFAFWLLTVSARSLFFGHNGHTALEMTLPFLECHRKSEGTPRNLHIWTISLPSFKIL